TGPWQIGAGVTAAVVASVFLGGSPILIGQAAASAVLVATLAPPKNGIYYTRFLDALIGGVVGIMVMALLLPLNPLTHIRRAAGPVPGDGAGSRGDRGRRVPLRSRVLRRRRGGADPHDRHRPPPRQRPPAPAGGAGDPPHRRPRPRPLLIRTGTAAHILMPCTRPPHRRGTSGSASRC